MSGCTLTPHPSLGLREPAVVETSTLQQTKQRPEWVCVREWEAESVCVCVCVCKYFMRLLTDMFIPVDYCRPHCHGDNHHDNSRVTFIRASRNSLRVTLRSSVLFSWCWSISRPDEGIAVLFLFSSNRKINEQPKGRTLTDFYWSRCLIYVWTLRLWCTILGTLL